MKSLGAAVRTSKAHPAGLLDGTPGPAGDLVQVAEADGQP
jgi:hypothetical protein